ncbi:hypothetical protein [Bacillus subtilis]|uniref:hypothetical protein n=1 Tax=Bacillus subtilis TaxID=1423 RepID=UPI000A0F7854|nr:hypothetical protein [Bacillus subtilis]MEC4031873.1 hypothetical protein [Bacillus subtilis]
MDFNFNLKDKKFWIKVIAAIFLIPFVLNMTLFQFTTGFTYQGGDWLSFWGSYLGGFSSGIIALIVAFATIREDRRKHSYDMVIKQLPVMVRIKMELEKIINNIDRAKKVREDIMETHNVSIEDLELVYMVDVDMIDKEKWDSLDKLQDIDLQVELLEVKQFYEIFSESLRYDIVNNRQDLRLVELDIRNKQKAAPILHPLEEYRLQDKLAQIGREIDYHQQIKKNSFTQLDGGFRDEIEKILQKLLSAMDKIQQEKKNFEQG